MLSSLAVRFSGHRLTQARLAADMSQTDLAVAVRKASPRLKANPSDISRYESGKTTPGANVLAAIAKATGQEIDFFYEQGGDDDLEEEAAQVTDALIDRIVEKRLQKRLRELGVQQ